MNYLYKKGTSGACNTGNEPYSELIASVVADILNIPHIEYTIDEWNGVLCSKCKLYTSEEYGYITMAEYMTGLHGEKDQWTYDVVCKKLEKYDLAEKFKKMLLFDFLINNEDRHFSNFGVVVNNDTMEVLDFMPLVDHGYSSGNFMIDVDEVENLKYKQGTFGLALNAQGIAIVLEDTAIAKQWGELITKNISRLDELSIPKIRIVIAKAILFKNINTINEL